MAIDAHPWQSPCSLNTQVKRATVLREIREFFHERSVLEVDVPVLGAATVTDPHIDSLVCTSGDSQRFLQSSPEYFLKRLLAQGYPSLYYLGKSFRDDEASLKHNCEFTLCEWYRLGFDDRTLMKEVGELLTHLDASAQVIAKSYREVFVEHCGLDPHEASLQRLHECAKDTLEFDFSLARKSDYLDLLFSHCVEPKLVDQATLVYDYPSCQSALAKTDLNQAGQKVARRFELFWRGLEIANGYWEAQDAQTLQARFADDLKARESDAKPSVTVDAKFLQAMRHGFPECAGVALGVDRLLMCLLNQNNISHVMSFSEPYL